MNEQGIIRVATCQFSVCGDIKRNAAQIRRQIQQAKKQRADVVHFPECALSGYAGTDFDSWDGFDWDALTLETQAICHLAREENVWVILGSSHRLTGEHLPHNSLYVVDPTGSIVERYDKCFCTNRDLKNFSPGNHLAVFTINGIRCGLLICYDSRFPELYREYKKMGVQCIFHSFYNARGKGPSILTTIIPPTVQTRAATNYIWISANNSSGYYQAWSSILVRPNGEIAASLRRNRAGVMVNEVNTCEEFYDSSGPFRDGAMAGILHSGEPVQDPRSEDRHSV